MWSKESRRTELSGGFGMFGDDVLVLKMENTTREKMRAESDKWRIFVFSSSLQPLILTTSPPFLLMYIAFPLI